MSPNQDLELLAIQNKTRFKLLRLVAVMGLIMAAIFGIYHILVTNTYWLGGSLLMVSATGSTNLLLFKDPDDYYKAVTTLAIAAYLLSALLIFSGGQEGTGLYWSYPLLSITLFTTRFRVGLTLFILFMIVTAASWHWQLPWVEYTYSTPRQAGTGSCPGWSTPIPQPSRFAI